MGKFHEMNVFIAVAEERGFSAAARRLHMSAPAISRAISSLEERLGAQMLIRTTRSVDLNESGQTYLKHARRVLAKLKAADAAAIGINSTPSGEVKVTCPTLIGRRYIVPCIVDYLRQYPDVQAQCVFLDQPPNLLEEGFDVGIRFGDLADSSMRATQVGQYSSIVCGSTDYLEEYGRPTKLTDLNEHALVCFAGAHGPSHWRFNEGSAIMPIRIQPRATLTTIDAAVAVAKRGLGLVQLPSYRVASELANGTLEVVLGEYEPPPHPVHIVYGGSKSQSATVRTFIDLLAEQLRSTEALQPKWGSYHG